MGRHPRRRELALGAALDAAAAAPDWKTWAHVTFSEPDTYALR